MKKLYFLAMVIFGIYLFQATNIVLLFSDKVVPVKVELDKLQVTENAMRAIDFTMAYNNLTQDFACNGWAFCDSNKAGQKRIDLILRGEENSYMIPTTLISRPIQEYFPSYNIVSSNNGFGAVFSTLKLKNGIYEIMIYVYEADGYAGLARGGMKLVKDNQGIRTHVPGKVANKSKVGIVDDIVSSVAMDYDEKTQSTLFRGWIYQKDKPSQFQNVYLEFVDEGKNKITYETIAYARPDTAEYLQNEMYFYCGFEVIVPKDDLSGGNWSFKPIIERDGKLYSGPDYIETLT